MKHRTDSEILSQLVAITKAKAVAPTPEELEEIRKLEQFKIKSDADKLVSLRERQRKQLKAEMLAKARGEGATETDA